jgi:hypothetical protein
MLDILYKIKKLSGFFTVPGSVSVSQATILVQPGLPGRVSQPEKR